MIICEELNMKLLLLLIVTCLLCSCGPLYYGYLPGTDYQMLEPQEKIDLKGKSFDIRFVDNRGTKTSINCSDYTLDRETELEGNLGADYFRECVLAMIRGSNGKIDPQSPNKVVVELEGESFKLIGYVYAVGHGFAQFKVTSPFLSKTYCADMTDHDTDAPLKWYSLTTRKSASRLMVSGATRRTAENFVRDLAKVEQGPTGLIGTLDK
jgi:hypothetical protein